MPWSFIGEGHKVTKNYYVVWILPYRGVALFSFVLEYLTSVESSRKQARTTLCSSWLSTNERMNACMNTFLVLEFIRWSWSLQQNKINQSITMPAAKISLLRFCRPSCSLPFVLLQQPNKMDLKRMGMIVMTQRMTLAPCVSCDQWMDRRLSIRCIIAIIVHGQFSRLPLCH